MSFLNADKVAAAYVNFNAKMNTALEDLRKPDAFWRMLATEVASSAKIEQHDWLGPVPGFTEWVGERKIGKVAASNYQITNKKWASGLEVDQDDLEDDRLGIYAPKIQTMVEKAMVHRLNLMVDFMVNGFATTKYGGAYDGAAFFSSRSGLFNNKATATLDDAGAYDAAWVAMLAVKDEDGEPMGVFQGDNVWLIVGPSNRATARALLLAERNANGSTNTNFGTAKLYISPKLVGGDAAKWFLVDLSHPIKPLIFQSRREIAFRAPNGPDSHEKFMKDKLYFGADARYNVGFGLPQTAYGSDGTT